MKELECVVIDNVPRCRRESQSNGFEIIEDLAVGIVNGSMTLIDDDEIKKMRRQVLRLIPDDVEHGGVSRYVDAAIFGDEPLFADIGPARLIGQMFFERCQRLLSERNAVNQESIFSAWPARISASIMAIQVRVFPVPVAITRRRSRFFCSMPSNTAGMARIW